MYPAEGPPVVARAVVAGFERGGAPAPGAAARGDRLTRGRTHLPAHAMPPAVTDECAKKTEADVGCLFSCMIHSLNTQFRLWDFERRAKSPRLPAGRPF